jgi:hypothetical protein
LERYGASPTSDPTPNPADPDPSRELLSIVDDLNDVRYLVDAAWMAADSLAKEERSAMKALISVAFEKLTAARDRLDAARCPHPPIRSSRRSSATRRRGPPMSRRRANS